MKQADKNIILFSVPAEKQQTFNKNRKLLLVPTKII
jgi:hypothetical protein